MLIFAIDDEPKMLRLLHKAIVEAAPDACVLDFSLGSAALSAIREEGLLPDVIFSDIQMPRPSGLELAVQLKTCSPKTKIVFVTGYDEYALDAFRVHAGGYVLKPVSAAQIREELENLSMLPDVSADRLQVRCFGSFEVFWHGTPLTFKRRKTKELFAYLIDREGAACTAEEIIAELWEEESNLRNAKHNLRNLTTDLRTTLDGIGQSDVLIRSSGTLAVNRSAVDCDYYRMLDGDMYAVNAHRGEYMSQYLWAQFTEGKLYFR